MLPGAWGHSATIVEFAQLPAGLAAWQRHSLGIYRVCGPLSKFLYALPAHLAGVRVDYPESFDSNIRSRQEWEVGRLFQSQNRERYHRIYRWSRLLSILVTVLGGYLVCEWSTSVFGAWPGVVSLCVWCWLPPILAHGSLVTSDVLSAVMLVLAARSFWAFLLRPSPVTTILAGLTLGLAQATKFTFLILYPCWVLILIGRVVQLGVTLSGENRPRSATPTRLVVFGLVALVISVIVIDALYLFHDVGICLAHWDHGRSSLAHDLRRMAERPATAWLLWVPIPFPLEFLRGLDFQLADTERLQSAYLLGQTRMGGWWHWYLVASMIKVPLPALALFALALFRLPAALRDRDPIFWSALCLLVPATEAALVISATTGTGTNAAFRYLIPSFALLCVFVGRVWDARSRVLRLTTISLVGWLAINAIVSLPDHLGWQNELGWAWRRSSGRPALIGDSLDWGQDLARLGDWVSRHSSEGSTQVCVFGMGEAEPYGLNSPRARPNSDGWNSGDYLCVSEGVLFDDNVFNCVSIGGGRSGLSQSQRETLFHTRPIDWVGRTIRIYRLRDLVRNIPIRGPSDQ